MLIGLLSDTHINVPDETLPPQIRTVFKGVDLILHAGDIWIPSVLDQLETIAPIIAAWGDDDMEEDLGDDSRMIKGHTLSFDGVTLWLSHVKPHFAVPVSPHLKINPKIHLFNPKKEPYPSRQGYTDAEGSPNVAIFGHTHSATIEYHKDVLLVNPGSLTFPSYRPTLGTVALLTIDSGEVEARIIQLE